MPKVLTSAAVAKLRARSERREIRDGGAKGLYLVIQATGAKSWALRLRRPSGKTAKMHLGSVYVERQSGERPALAPVQGAPLTLEAARRLAAEILHEAAAGRDVVGAYLAGKHQRRVEAKAGAATAFGALVPKFAAEYTRRGRKLRRMSETARLLGWRAGGDPEVISGSLCARWRDRPVAEIDRREIRSVVAEAQEHGVPGSERRSRGPTKSRARALLVALSTFFRWCLREEYAAANPCRDVPRPEPPQARDRVLTDAEIVAFWRACDKVGEPFEQALKLLLLTGCRLSEVAGMRFAELSDDFATWSIPGARTKNARPHVVALSPLAREVLASVRRVEGGLAFTTSGRTPISGWSKCKRRLDALMGSPPPWRLHDLRRTAASGMQRLGVRTEVVERALNHVSGSFAGVAGVYQRDPMLDDTRAALLRWSQHVTGLVSGDGGGKVLQLRGRRGGKTP